MEQKRIKLLIAVFLVLAAVTGTGAVALSGVVSWWSERALESEGRITVELGPVAPSVGAEAAVETLTAGAPFSPTSGVVSSGKQNATDQAAANIAEAIIKVNPNGPSGDGGEDGLVAPSIETLADKLAEAARNVEVPDWDREVSSVRVNVLDTFSAEDLGRYEKTINAIMEKNFLATGISDLLARDGATERDAARTRLSIEYTLRETEALAVPKTLLAFHWSFIKLLIYEKNVAALAGGLDDPVRVSVIAEAKRDAYDRVMFAFQNEAKKAAAAKTLGGNPDSGIMRFARELFGIKTAHAFFFSITFDPSNFGRMIWEFIEKIATEKLKDVLIHKLTSQVVGWVQGNGKPQFITDTKKFLGNVANSAVGEAIREIEPGLCQSFGDLVRLNLQPTRLSIADRTRCTLTEVVGNTQDFYNDFSSGGWQGYGALFEPSNNVFGSILQTRDIVIAQSEEKKAIAVKDSSDNAGFLSNKRCVSTFMLDVDRNPEAILDAQSNANYVSNNCEDVGAASGKCQATYCKDYETTTPGGVFASQLNTTGLGSVMNRIVGAGHFTALITALVNSALNKLVAAGQQGILRLGGGTEQGIGEAIGAVTATGACTGLTGGDLDACQGGSGSLGRQRNDLLVLIDNAISAEEGIIDGGNEWTVTANGIKDTLRTIAQVCSAKIPPSPVGDVATARLADIQTLTEKVSGIIGSSVAAKATFEGLRAQVVQVSTTSDFEALSNQFFGINTGAAEKGLDMQGRLTRLNTLKAAAEGTLIFTEDQSMQCSEESLPLIAESS